MTLRNKPLENMTKEELDSYEKELDKLILIKDLKKLEK